MRHTKTFIFEEKKFNEKKYMGLYTCVLCPQRPEEGEKFLGAGAYGCWELSSFSLEGQQVVLSIEPSLLPLRGVLGYRLWTKFQPNYYILRQVLYMLCRLVLISGQRQSIFLSAQFG